MLKSASNCLSIHKTLKRSVDWISINCSLMGMLVWWLVFISVLQLKLCFVLVLATDSRPCPSTRSAVSRASVSRLMPPPAGVFLYIILRRTQTRASSGRSSAPSAPWWTWRSYETSAQRSAKASASSPWATTRRRPSPSPVWTATGSENESYRCRSKLTKHTRPDGVKTCKRVSVTTGNI